MKRIITLVLALLLLSSCFVLSVSAAQEYVPTEEYTVTFSENFQKLYYKGVTYSRFDASFIEEPKYFEMDNEFVELSPEQYEAVKGITVRMDESYSIADVAINFYDGAVLYVTFIQDKYLDTYNKMKGGEWQEYTVDFNLPVGNTVKTEKAKLKGDSVTLKEGILYSCDTYTVYTVNEDGRLKVFQGALLINDDKYYYVDFSELEIYSRKSFYPRNFTEVSAWEITDEQLIHSIKEAEEKYYNNDLGFLYDDEFTKSVSMSFLVFAFGIVPLILFIVFLVLAVKAKTVYRKLFGTVSVLSASVLVLFIIIAVLISILSV